MRDDAHDWLAKIAPVPSEVEDFCSAIRLHSLDRAMRLVYSDWLEEQGDEWAMAAARWLRVDIELAQNAPNCLKDLRESWQELEIKNRGNGRWLQHTYSYALESLAEIKGYYACPACYGKASWRTDEIDIDASVKECEKCRLQWLPTSAVYYNFDGVAVSVDWVVIRRKQLREKVQKLLNKVSRFA